MKNKKLFIAVNNGKEIENFKRQFSTQGKITNYTYQIFKISIPVFSIVKY